MKKRYKNRIVQCFLLLACLGCITRCAEQHAPKVYVVEMKQMQFQPNELTVQKGDTVVFVNHDMVDHNIVEASKGLWSSSMLPAGKSWKTAIDKSYDYICTIHPTMKGKITVK